jgi:hypothetical protein
VVGEHTRSLIAEASEDEGHDACPSKSHLTVRRRGYPRALTIIDVLRISFKTVRDGHRKICSRKAKSN